MDKVKINKISDLIIGLACDIQNAEGVLNLLHDSLGEDISQHNERSTIHLVVMHIQSIRKRLNEIDAEYF